jgi:AraC-like DNA-binding protein
MITFHSRQPDCDRRARKNENSDTVNFTSQIASLICTATFTNRVKLGAIIFKLRCSRTVLCYRFDRVEALPLVWTRFLRLAKNSPKTARSPARWSRDGRETSGEKSGKISRVMSAQRPGNGRTVATAMPPNVRQDGSQDNLPCAGLGCAMSAPETCETTCNLAAQQPRNGQGNISQAARGNFAVSFNHDIQKL